MRKKIGMIKSHLVKGILCVGLPLFVFACTDDNSYTYGTWYAASDLDGPERMDAASFVIENYPSTGRSTGFLFGGWNGKGRIDSYLKDMYAFTMDGTTSWSECTPLDVENAMGRAGAVGFSIGQYGYIATGYNPKLLDSDGRPTYFSDTWRFDPSGNGGKGEWKKMENSFPDDFKPRHHAVSFSIGGYGYLGTGENEDDGNLKDFWKFDPNTSKWTRLQGDEAFPGKPRNGAVAFVINNKAYVCCGIGSSYPDDFFMFDPNDAAKPWKGTLDGSLAHISNRTKEKFDDDYDAIPRAYAVALVINGNAYLVTGERGASKSDYWVYYPETDRWNNDDFTPITSSKEIISTRIGAVGFSNGKRGFFGTGGASRSGDSKTNRSSDFYELKPDERYED